MSKISTDRAYQVLKLVSPVFRAQTGDTAYCVWVNPEQGEIVKVRQDVITVLDGDDVIYVFTMDRKELASAFRKVDAYESVNLTHKPEGSNSAWIGIREGSAVRVFRVRPEPNANGRTGVVFHGLS